MAQNLVASPPGSGISAGTSSSSSNTHSNNNNNHGSTSGTTTIGSGGLVATTTTAKLTPNQQRLQVLKQRRAELEKRLLEKNQLLQELCRKEGYILGVINPPVNNGNKSTATTNTVSHDDSVLATSKQQQQHNNPNTQSLPRKIGTSFTLSEKYLNKRTPSANSPLNGLGTNTTTSGQSGGVVGGGGGVMSSSKEEEEMNNLLLQRDIQEQICKASLKLLNDTTLTKSIRRKHKQSYELAQQKLMAISDFLTVMTTKKKTHEIIDSTAMSSKTLPISVKTNFKQTSSNLLQQHSTTEAILNGGGCGSSLDRSPGAYYDASSYFPGNKNLYRSSSNSSSLGNQSNPALGKSSLSLDANHQLHHHNSHHHLSVVQQQHQQQQQHHQSTMPNLKHSNPHSYESKSLHNFVMTSGNNAISDPIQHHPQYPSAMMLPPNQFYPTAAASVRQFPTSATVLSPQQQVIIPQTGLGGYWMLNENNEKVWCSSGTYSQEPVPTQRFASLDRKAAIYIPPNHNHHQQQQHHPPHHHNNMKSKMPSPKISPRFEYQNENNSPNSSAVVGSFSMPTKSTSLGNFEFLVTTDMQQQTPPLPQQHSSHHHPNEDSHSMNSFNSDSNNNPQSNYGKPFTNAAAPPPLRPKAYHGKATATAVNSDKNWYETSLDTVVATQSAKPKIYHKPQPPLPASSSSSSVNNEAIPSGSSSSHLHVDIPPAQQILLERSLSHRLPGSNYVSNSPPVVRHSLYPEPGHHQQPPLQQQQFSPSSMVKRSASSAMPQNYHHHNHNSPQMASSPKIVQSSPRATNSASADDQISLESPKNVTVVQQGKFQPYKEESKPFEMSDFYKYSTKFRNAKPTTTTTQTPHQTTNSTLLTAADAMNNNYGGPSSPLVYHQIPPVLDNNTDVQKGSGGIYQPPNPSICHAVSYQ